MPVSNWISHVNDSFYVNQLFVNNKRNKQMKQKWDPDYTSGDFYDKISLS